MSSSNAFRIIDPTNLPPHFDAAAAEARLDAEWEKRGVYRWDESRGRDQTFVIDTPPPTVSGSLHIGHVFSYTHTDIIARQRRMLGMNVFYPMGWDDNGLPTERRVQNHFNVGCEPGVPYEEGLALSPATDAQLKKERARLVSRKNFIELCHVVTQEDEKAFEALFRRIGLSVDWQQTYATIDDRSRHLAQLSFLDLHGKGHLYNLEAPTMWDVDFKTAVAQAEVEDREKAGAFHDIRFGIEGSADSFVISTTRPELLAACVGVCAHPNDVRFQKYFGKRAVTPLFRAPVPVFPSELADPQKGTGILMVCTFGDQTDVAWWREQKLPTRQIIGKDGRLVPLVFGSQDWPSLNPEAANAFYAQLEGKNVTQARKAVVEILRDAAAEATPGLGAPFQGEPRAIQHAVKHYEKGDRPLEFITTRQWFVKLVAQKDALLAQGRRVGWHPDFMHHRYANWTENLGIDWCVSRQRYFGVPIPVWYPLDAQGQVLYCTPMLPAGDALPIDPMSDVPAGYTEAQRGKPGGFTGDPDVFDTWFTSSLTPQISSRWLLEPKRHAKLFPADIRPQSHEIIRTWAFYTIAKAMLHQGSVPWNHVVISGWILDPDRKKMSKSKGNTITPASLIEKYSADAVRYWAASAKLGTDTAFDEKVMANGKRLATKLFNAAKYVLQQEASAPLPAAPGITQELDRAFIGELRGLIARAGAAFDRFEYADALRETEQFFWSRFTDTYLELAKTRARGEGLGRDGVAVDSAARTSAVATLRVGLSVLLRLFAPMLPYITEEVWGWAFADERGEPSIHRAAWPTTAELDGIEAPADAEAFALAIELYAAINRGKTANGASGGRVVTTLAMSGPADKVARLPPVIGDVVSAARVRSHAITAADGEEFAIREMVIAPKETRPDVEP